MRSEPPPETPPVVRRRFLTVREWKRLLKVAVRAGSRADALVRILYEAGLRREEIGKLRVSYAEKLPKLYVWRGKGSRSGWVTLSKQAAAALRAWRAELWDRYPVRCAQEKAQMPLFPGRQAGRGLTGRAVYKIFAALAAAAQLPAEVSHPHVLKHSRVQHLLDFAMANKVNPWEMIETVAQIVGHKSAKTTVENYVSRFGKASRFAQQVTQKLAEE